MTESTKTGNAFIDYLKYLIKEHDKEVVRYASEDRLNMAYFCLGASCGIQEAIDGYGELVNILEAGASMIENVKNSEESEEDADVCGECCDRESVFNRLDVVAGLAEALKKAVDALDGSGIPDVFSKFTIKIDEKEEKEEE